MRSKFTDLSVVAVLAIVAALLAVLGVDFAFIRVPLGLLLVLALPGYTVVAALFPRHPLQLAERLVVILGASLICTILCGLLLNITPWGLTPATWAVSLSLVTIAGALVARWRRTGDEAAPAIGSGRLLPSLSIPQALLFGLAALVVAGALGVARAGAIEAPTPGYTQLWLLPVGTGVPQQVQVGVSNAEDAPVEYKLQLVQNTTVLQEWANIPLAPGAKWEMTATLSVKVSESQPVAALLYRQDAPGSIYRRVAWWPESTSSVAAGQPTATLPDEWPTTAPAPGVPTATAAPATAVAAAPPPPPSPSPSPSPSPAPPTLAPAATATVAPDTVPGLPTMASAFATALAQATQTARLAGPTPTVVPGVPPTPLAGLRLGVGAWAAGLDGASLRVRVAPGLQSQQIAGLRAGTIVLVIGGPQQADGMDWWQVIGWNRVAQPGWVSGLYLEAVACCPPSAGGQ